MKASLPVVLTVLAGTIVPSQLASGANGTLRYFQLAGPNWDQYTTSGDARLQSFIRERVWRIATYTPFFDDKLSWMPYAWFYTDSYAMYSNSALATAHPEWILKDALGRKLYIPWGCSNGTCPQYAGDISNPQYRSYMINAIIAALRGTGTAAYGYRGIFLDDVNLNMSVGDGNGVLTAPLDRATGKPMTSTAWERYFAEYVEAIRAAVPPAIEILHNSVWYAGTGTDDPYVKRQIAAADYVLVERGFGDGGLTGGSGFFSLSALMSYIDRVHAVGTSIVTYDYYLKDQVYSLATYFLVNNGTDSFSVAEQTPGNWPARLYSVNLGYANSARRKWSNVWRRDFSNGIVLVNEPGAGTQTILLPAGMTDTDGNPVSYATLGPKQGGIFLYDGSQPRTAIDPQPR